MWVRPVRSHSHLQVRFHCPSPAAGLSCKQVADEINTQHTNSRRLPGHSCPKQLSATTDLEGMVRASMLLLLAVPSAHIAATAQRCVEHLLPEAVLVCCAKGAWLPANGYSNSCQGAMFAAAMLAALSMLAASVCLHVSSIHRAGRKLNAACTVIHKFTRPGLAGVLQQVQPAADSVAFTILMGLSWALLCRHDHAGTCIAKNLANVEHQAFVCITYAFAGITTETLQTMEELLLEVGCCPCRTCSTPPAAQACCCVVGSLRCRVHKA